MHAGVDERMQRVPGVGREGAQGKRRQRAPAAAAHLLPLGQPALPLPLEGSVQQDGAAALLPARLAAEEGRARHVCSRDGGGQVAGVGQAEGCRQDKERNGGGLGESCGGAAGAAQRAACPTFTQAPHKPASFSTPGGAASSAISSPLPALHRRHAPASSQLISTPSLWAAEKSTFRIAFWEASHLCHR